VSLYGRAFRFAMGGHRLLVFFVKFGTAGAGLGVAGVWRPRATVILVWSVAKSGVTVEVFGYFGNWDVGRRLWLKSRFVS
jgi:hypothetical protein